MEHNDKINTFTMRVNSCYSKNPKYYHKLVRNVKRERDRSWYLLKGENIMFQTWWRTLPLLQYTSKMVQCTRNGLMMPTDYKNVKMFPFSSPVYHKVYWLYFSDKSTCEGDSASAKSQHGRQYHLPLWLSSTPTLQLFSSQYNGGQSQSHSGSGIV